MKPRCWINGVAQTDMAVTDRGLHYGDGLFETLAVFDGHCPHLPQHLQRLRTGAERLAIPLPNEALITEEITRAALGQTRAVIKLIVTSGSGGRGYARPANLQPTRMLLCYDWPDYPRDHWQHGVVLRLCQTRLGCHPALAGIKHLNRLEQVLARQEWQDNAFTEGLMCDVHGNVIEGIMSNIFVVRNHTLHTPLTDNCGVAGVMRRWLLENAPHQGIEVNEVELAVADIRQADEVLLTNSLIGLWPVRSFETREYQPGPVYWTMLRHLVKDYPVVDL